MKFSEQWLRTLVDPPLDTTALCDKLTMTGLEVEEMTAAAPPFSGVVVGHILTVAPHPNADRLRVCAVDVGRGSPLAIVCGAPNAAAGMKVPAALAGALLPGGLAIKATTMRGVESQGMLCSAKELGIDEDASGLLALPADAAPGANVRHLLALDDTLITLKLTPNRADCLSLHGLARDVAATTGAPLTPPPLAAAQATSNMRRNVRVEAMDGCPRFASRIIEGIDPSAPTPAWMKTRLQRCGIRSISAIVDITNYVMLERGQPMHAYDDALLSGDVVVRYARPGEELMLLNGQVLKLEPDLLLVCDERQPLGLAGIMGGERSGIGPTTTTVFLEAAFWTPSVIQGRSRRLGFVSDAGFRFERGVDFAGCADAIERATQLIVECCGGRAGPLDDVCGELPSRPTVRVRPARVARLLGIDLPRATIAGLLARLGLTPADAGDDLLVTSPSFRFDLAIEEDYVEEIARLHGYDAIPAAPAAHVQRMLGDSEQVVPLRLLRQRLVDRDWYEAITFSFVHSTTESALFPARADAVGPVAVLNPIASHLDVMRTTLWGGLIEVLKTNLARRQDRVRVFEVGRCFERDGKGFRQPTRIGGLAYGDAGGEQWGGGSRDVDFYDVKADLEALAGTRTVRTLNASHPALHPGRSAQVEVDGQSIGWLGELHPRLVAHFELPRAPVVFELDVAPMLMARVPATHPIPRLPAVRRDIAVVVDEGVPAGPVVDALRAAGIERVTDVRLFDVYRGPGLPTGKKSLAILVLMQDTERTLTDADIDGVVMRLVRVVAAEFGGSLRQ
jgi:phenylalanyl-tRNA synthetase beta chain